jgi:hypothetical protein
MPRPATKLLHTSLPLPFPLPLLLGFADELELAAAFWRDNAHNSYKGSKQF